MPGKHRKRPKGPALEPVPSEILDHFVGQGPITAAGVELMARPLKLWAKKQTSKFDGPSYPHAYPQEKVRSEASFCLASHPLRVLPFPSGLHDRSICDAHSGSGSSASAATSRLFLGARTGPVSLSS
jgi:hypothetical protein